MATKYYVAVGAQNFKPVDGIEFIAVALGQGPAIGLFQTESEAEQTILSAFVQQSDKSGISEVSELEATNLLKKKGPPDRQPQVRVLPGSRGPTSSPQQTEPPVTPALHVVSEPPPKSEVPPPASPETLVERIAVAPVTSAADETATAPEDDGGMTKNERPERGGTPKSRAERKAKAEAGEGDK